MQYTTCVGLDLGLLVCVVDNVSQETKNVECRAYICLGTFTCHARPCVADAMTVTTFLRQCNFFCQWTDRIKLSFCGANDFCGSYAGVYLNCVIGLPLPLCSLAHKWQNDRNISH